MTTTTRTREQSIGGAFGVVVSLLTMFGPISMDLYLPVLPRLAADLRRRRRPRS